ncbi:MAG TPA: AI-2E family transporter, partial [Leptolyngbyaceae cyanobacterium M65_K2018_010]|nr:AI-2E family transporter [Leptolyngbyaceae cyanobacterium M65_K2018_010]
MASPITPPSSLAPILKVLAAVVVILVGIHLAAPVLNPILFALVLSLLFGPLYTGLKRRGTPTPLALLAMLVGLLLVFGLLFSLIGLSVA